MAKNSCHHTLQAALLALLAAFSLSASAHAVVRYMWLDELDVGKVRTGQGTAKRNKSVEGNPIRIGGRQFARGIGTHAPSVFWIQLDAWTSDFTASVGVDDEVAGTDASVEFIVFGKGKALWQSGNMKAGDPPKEVNVKIRGVKKLGLIVTDGGDGGDSDHADWADAKLRVTGKDPKAISPDVFKRYLLTPKPPRTPRINGACLFGARPGSPLLYKIPATGDRPMTFGAKDLPPGLTVDKNTGIITGALNKKGTHKLTLVAQNALAKSEKPFQIIVGDRICLTPPLGWNSWNCWAAAVDAEKVKAAAKAMIDSGLANHGWTYINIDDTWQHARSGSLNAIQPNDKFPDMKAIADYVHSLGLKIGIYSTPWVTSYAGRVGGSADNPQGKWSAVTDPQYTGWRHGKHSFARNDAQQWSQWGIDYLKYDWNPNDIPHAAEMANALGAAGRDIVYSLSNSAPFDNAANWSKLANCWRTTGDITDTWESISSIGFSQGNWSPHAAPGRFNDADMLVVGSLGWGPDLHPSNLTPDEQYTHITLWSLLASPLLLGCDLTQLDDFTLNLLTNDEVLAVNQDPLAQQARRIAGDDTYEIWAKDTHDGAKAVGLFNRDPLHKDPKQITLNFTDLGLRTPHRVRDLWRQTNLGTYTKTFTTKVPPHGVKLLIIRP